VPSSSSPSSRIYSTGQSTVATSQSSSLSSTFPNAAATCQISSASSTSVSAASSTTQSSTLSLFAAASSPSITTSPNAVATLTQTSQSVPTIVPEVFTSGGTYNKEGCCTDSTRNGAPLENVGYDVTVSTVEQCLDSCGSTANNGPFLFAGIEGATCYCASNLDLTAFTSPGACTEP
jgi:hypothetical protein